MCISILICLKGLAGKHSIFCIMDQKELWDGISSYREGHWLSVQLLEGCSGGTDVHTLSQNDPGLPSSDFRLRSQCFNQIAVTWQRKVANSGC